MPSARCQLLLRIYQCDIGINQHAQITQWAIPKTFPIRGWEKDRGKVFADISCCELYIFLGLR
jgi:hypothetical protein